jgi:hypothetical protein
MAEELTLEKPRSGGLARGRRPTLERWKWSGGVEGSQRDLVETAVMVVTAALGASDSGAVWNFEIHRGAPYIRRLTDECTTTYICWLTDEYSGLYSSVPSTFLNFGTEEFSSIIFLSTEEYKNLKEDALFSCTAVDFLGFLLSFFVCRSFFFGFTVFKLSQILLFLISSDRFSMSQKNRPDWFFRFSWKWTDLHWFLNPRSQDNMHHQTLSFLWARNHRTRKN